MDISEILSPKFTGYTVLEQSRGVRVTANGVASTVTQLIKKRLGL